jgi:hypothetical protein
MMDAAERELFASSLQQATDAASGADLDDALEAIGWAEALEVDPHAATATLFELQGAAGATSSALGRVVLGALGIDVPDDAGVVLPALGSADVPAQVDAACVPAPEVRVRGVGLGDLRRRARVVIVASRDGALTSTTVDTDLLSPSVVGGMDPELGLVQIDATFATSGPWNAVEGDWADAVAAARRAVGHEMVGAMRTMLRLAREHALDRIQFDRPIASFQAVRHRLAETLVAIEAADAALEGAWIDGTPLGASVAKAIAGHSAKDVRRHCQQVLAGIGFTTEHDLHRHIRRTLVLDAFLGDARTLTRQIGADLIEAGRLPSILPL